MTFFLILILVCFMVLCLMLYAKSIQLKTGKNIMGLSNPKREQKLLKIWSDIKHQVAHISRESLANFFHATAKLIEDSLVHILKRLGRKFVFLGDLVRGKNMMPRSRGSVSFFLKNIEEHKKNM